MPRTILRYLPLFGTITVPSGSLGYNVASANAAIAGGMLIMNLVPIRLGVMETDGLQIWHSVRSLRGIARS